MSGDLVQSLKGFCISADQAVSFLSFSTKMGGDIELCPLGHTVSADQSENQVEDEVWVEIDDSYIFSRRTTRPHKEPKKNLRRDIKRILRLQKRASIDPPEPVLASSPPPKRTKKLERGLRRWARIQDCSPHTSPEEPALPSEEPPVGPSAREARRARWKDDKGAILREARVRDRQVKRDRLTKNLCADDGYEDMVNPLEIYEDYSYDDDAASLVAHRDDEPRWDYDGAHRAGRPKVLYSGNGWFRVLR